MHTGAWQKSATHSHEVRGTTLGIVGYGRIGTQVSVLAETLGMRVIFCDVTKQLPLGNAEQASLDDVLRESDVVTLHVPDTALTRGMIGEKELKFMKKGAKLINNARGSVVDLEALAEAIRSGHIGGGECVQFPVCASHFHSPACLATCIACACVSAKRAQHSLR